MWRALNLKLAFQKGQRGASVEWIGCEVTIDAAGVTATIKEETRREMLELVEGALADSVISLERLRSLAGKLSNGARLITI